MAAAFSTLLGSAPTSLCQRLSFARRSARGATGEEEEEDGVAVASRIVSKRDLGKYQTRRIFTPRQ